MQQRPNKQQRHASQTQKKTPDRDSGAKKTTRHLYPSSFFPFDLNIHTSKYHHPSHRLCKNPLNNQQACLERPLRPTAPAPEKIRTSVT